MKQDGSSMDGPGGMLSPAEEKCFTYGIDDWVSYEVASRYSSFISML